MVSPHLSPKEEEAVQAVFRVGDTLQWEPNPECNGYGGGYTAFGSDRRRGPLFSAGGIESFRMLYEQALGLRGGGRRGKDQESPRGSQNRNNGHSNGHLTAREVAQKLIAAMDGKPRGSKKLAEIAGIEYTDLIKEILSRLHTAGKIQKVRSEEDGKVRWCLSR